MGQKINPHGFRVGPTLNKGWDSVFYADNKYKELLIPDLKIRDLIFKKYGVAQISRVLIERTPKMVISIYVRKPGVIIGKSGADIEKLKKDVQKIYPGEVFINIHEVKRPDVDAEIVAQDIAMQLSKRGSFRKAMKKAIKNCFKAGGLGIKVQCSGRLGGAEIARTEWYREGRVPLHTLRADVDYAIAEALTTYGIIGVKVWIYKGDFVDNKKEFKNSVKVS